MIGVRLPTHERGLRWTLFAFVALTPLLTAGAKGASGATEGKAFTVGTTDVLGRLRVFGTPGDAGLENRRATAIVARKDAALVDFWPNAPAEPTVPQLGNIAAIDGLWSFSSAVAHGGRRYGLDTSDVAAAGGRVTATKRVAIGPSELVVTTVYALVDDAPALSIETTIYHERGAYPLEVELVDAARWGNVDYYAEGVGKIGSRFDDQTRWVGRKGASGDLVLSAAPGRTFHAFAATDHAGFQPPVEARHGVVTLEPGDSTVVVRELAYRTIAVARAPAPAGGVLRVDITDAGGRLLPSKLTLRGVDDTPNPDFGNDGGESGAGRFVWSGTGQFRRPLPAGKYEVLATAGIEHALARWTVEVPADGKVALAGSLARVIETPGWISADLHLHQAPSVDADIAFSTRIVSIAAEGLELAVATDHYVATDFAPTVRKLVAKGRLARPLLTMVGSEVSTTGNRFGHFNVFPIALDARIPYDDTTPAALMEAMRTASPAGVLQVNHPRWNGIGYFKRFELDRETAEVPEQHRETYSAAFDAIEIYNGLDMGNEPGVLEVFRDFLHLIGRGHRYTATGNSDSHKLFFVDPGVPRNLIHYGEAPNDEADLNARPDAIVSALRGGRVLVTSGPIVDVSILGAGPGQTVETTEPTVPLVLRVRAAPWIDVSRAEIYVGPSDRPLVERRIPSSENVVRHEETLHIAVPSDTFVVVRVLGERPLPNVYSNRWKPMAFTNPIWLERSKAASRGDPNAPAAPPSEP